MTTEIQFDGSIDQAEEKVIERIHGEQWVVESEQHEGAIIVRVIPALLPTPVPDDLLSDVGQYRVNYWHHDRDEEVTWPPSPSLSGAAERLTEKLRIHDWFVRVEPVVIPKSNPGFQERLFVIIKPTDSWMGPAANASDKFEGFQVYQRREK